MVSAHVQPFAAPLHDPREGGLRHHGKGTRRPHRLAHYDGPRIRIDSSMKHIGIAAITAEGAALVYRRICAQAARRLGDHQHPEITLHAFSLAEHVNVGDERREKWADLMRRSIDKLCATGADFVICPSNTPHDAYALVAPGLPVPWLHIAEAVRREAVRRGVRRPLLLGTRFTLQGRIYDDVFDGSGIALLRTDAEETERVHRIILDELVPGQPGAGTRAYFSRLVEQYAARGADGVILGCTELPLAIDETSACVAVLDSTALLADWALDHALE